MRKDIAVTVKYYDVEWYVEGTYYPAHYSARENGQPIEPDEPECIEIDVFICHDGGQTLIPFAALDEDFVYSLGEKALEAYKQSMGAAAEDYEEPLYPCDDCGKLRTKSEGGTTFTVCEDCWDKHYAKMKKEMGKLKEK